MGIQTVVLATAGAVSMPWRFFTAAQMIGALLWALIYSTVGLAVMVGRRRRAVTPWELDRRPEPQLSVDS